MTLGNRISTLRVARKYSQEYLAEKIDVSRQAVSKWENDISSPDTKNLIRLAELFEVSVEYLATGKESSNIRVEEKPNRYVIFKKLAFICCLINSYGVLLHRIILWSIYKALNRDVSISVVWNLYLGGCPKHVYCAFYYRMDFSLSNSQLFG